MGITKLKVENRFIDYFRAKTEIYQGMSLIDNKLGGTTPLDLIVDFKKEPIAVRRIRGGCFCRGRARRGGPLTGFPMS